jgi:hypothetical protein
MAKSGLALMSLSTSAETSLGERLLSRRTRQRVLVTGVGAGAMDLSVIASSLRHDQM